MKILLTSLFVLYSFVCFCKDDRLLNFFDKNKNVIEYSKYTLLYDDESKNPLWAMCYVDRNVLINNVKRNDCFRKDENGNGVSQENYRNSGLNKGHMIPCNYFLITEKLMRETFFMTNMSPQKGELNKELWKELEQIILDWVEKGREFIVVSGPVWTGKTRKKIGKDNVWVPEAYFKTIYDVKSNKKISFLFPNSDIDNKYNLSDFVVPSILIDKITGFNFFGNAESVITRDINNWYK